MKIPMWKYLDSKTRERSREPTDAETMIHGTGVQAQLCLYIESYHECSLLYTSVGIGQFIAAIYQGTLRSNAEN